MIKLLELFAGYGSQSMALKRLNVPFEIVGMSEIDKFAIAAHEAIHGKVTNFGDISKINEKDIPDCDLITYSFPCQDLSIAGKQLGIKKGTRSGLLWECERIIKHKKPTFLLMENVKNLVGKKFKPDFDKWCKALEEIGYTNYWKVINAKDCGVPQNRERVFMISIYNNYVDYIFPEKDVLDVFLKDILEKNVDEKYYLKPEQYSNLLKNIKEKGKFNVNPSGKGINGNVNAGNVSPTLTTNKGEGLKTFVGAAQRGRENGQNIELNKQKYSNSITTVQKDSLVAEIKHIANTDDNYEQNARVYSVNGISPTIASRDYKDAKKILEKGIKIRKLTPLECFRLMGVKDEDFYKIQKKLNETFYKGKNRSSSQLYKLAGNSIVVDVLCKIFENLKINNERTTSIS